MWIKEYIYLNRVANLHLNYKCHKTKLQFYQSKEVLIIMQYTYIVKHTVACEFSQ